MTAPVRFSPPAGQRGIETLTDGVLVQLELTNPPPTGHTPFPQWTRQLWTGPNNPDPAPTATTQPKPPTVPPTSIAIIPHDPSLHVLTPPKTLPNSTKPIPRPPIAVAPPIRAGLVDPFTNSKSPQFELLVHPDYRPSQPRPKHDTRDTGFGNDVYSPLDYLPTGADSLYDVIFAIRRRNRLETNLSLQSLTIEIPVSDGLGDKPDAKGWIREPLLEAGDYSGTGVRMCSSTSPLPPVVPYPWVPR